MALLNRKRDTLKKLLGTSVAGAALVSSERWLRPVVDTVSIPAHASTTEAQERASVQLINSDGAVIPDGSSLLIGEIVTVVFTIMPNPGAGKNYSIRSYLNGTETSNKALQTNDEGKIALQGPIGDGAVDGDMEKLCIELNGDPMSACSGWMLEALILSDFNRKDNIESVDRHAVLGQLLDTPVSYWSYRRDDPSIRHIGPMAQDFSRAFAVGDSDRHIFAADGQGVAFASIQALYELISRQGEEIASLQREIAQLRSGD